MGLPSLRQLVTESGALQDAEVLLLPGNALPNACRGEVLGRLFSNPSHWLAPVFIRAARLGSLSHKVNLSDETDRDTDLTYVRASYPCDGTLVSHSGNWMTQCFTKFPAHCSKASRRHCRSRLSCPRPYRPFASSRGSSCRAKRIWLSPGPQNVRIHPYHAANPAAAAWRSFRRQIGLKNLLDSAAGSSSVSPGTSCAKLFCRSSAFIAPCLCFAATGFRAEGESGSGALTLSYSPTPTVNSIDQARAGSITTGRLSHHSRARYLTASRRHCRSRRRPSRHRCPVRPVRDKVKVSADVLVVTRQHGGSSSERLALGWRLECPFLPWVTPWQEGQFT